jgi:hypothetical protein
MKREWIMNVQCVELSNDDLEQLARAYRRAADDPAIRAPLRKWSQRMCEALLGEVTHRRTCWNAFLDSDAAVEIEAAALAAETG